MKYIFPILAVVWGGTAGILANDSRSPSSTSVVTAASTERGGEESPLSGQELVARAAEELLEHVTLQARIRQRVSLFDRKLTGTGHFYQAQARDRMVFRIDLKLPVGGKVMVLQQVNDGDYLWTQRDVGKKSSLGRVDLRRVRRASSGSNLPPAHQLAMGGISQLLHGLHANFEFQPPKAAMLSDVPVWVLHGKWRVGVEAGEGGESGPLSMPQVPDSVVLVLSRSDSLPLFPFRVEYARHRRRDGGKPVRTPIVAVDFFEVRVGGDLDSRLFAYSAGDRDLSDDTERFLREIK